MFAAYHSPFVLFRGLVFELHIEDRPTLGIACVVTPGVDGCAIDVRNFASTSRALFICSAPAFDISNGKILLPHRET